MKNIRLLVTYDGTHFFGWQKTAMGPSIEETLRAVLKQILQEPVKLQAASRTDRGVHAQRQVVNFMTEKDPPLKISLNRLLPSSIKVLDVKVMPPTFHPTLDAKKKLYTYCICFGPTQLPFHRHFSWHVPYQLNLNEMQSAAAYLIGEHDFSAFCNMHSNMNYPHKRRTIESIELTNLFEQIAPTSCQSNSEKFGQGANRLQIAIRGDHFLYKMARNIVGTLVYVGRGKLIADAIPEILASKRRLEAGITAPAHGLTLKEIYFSNTGSL